MTATNTSAQEFVSIVSHDLRAPIRHLRQFSALLTETLTEPTEEQKQYTEFIEKSAKQCSQMMDALTELSRLYTKPADVDSIDFTALLPEICADLAVRNNCQPQLQLNNKAEQAPLMDVEHARLLMLELAENAFKFRHANDELALRLDIASGDGQQVIQLSDNGIGVAPHFIEHCTTIFKQFDNSVAGVGKGLSIAAAIVRLYGGSMSIASGTDVSTGGTKVTIVLPLQK